MGKRNLTIANSSDGAVTAADLVNTDGVAQGSKLVERSGEIWILAEGDAVVSSAINTDGSEGVAAGGVEIRAGRDIRLESGAAVAAKGNGEGSWVRVLDNRWLPTLRGKLQLADGELLPSSEQFRVGGMSTVRGYPEGLLIGDDGYLFSAEASIPWRGAETDNPFASQMRALLFFDNGTAFPFNGNDKDDFLASVGTGVQVNLGPNPRGRLVVAQPLFQREDDQDHLRVHFYIESTPF